MTERSDAPDSPVTSVSAPQDFLRAMAREINSVSRENVSNTPDFILAEFLAAALVAFENASLAREKWYGKSLSIGGGTTAISATAPCKKGDCDEWHRLMREITAKDSAQPCVAVPPGLIADLEAFIRWCEEPAPAPTYDAHAFKRMAALAVKTLVKLRDERDGK